MRLEMLYKSFTSNLLRECLSLSQSHSVLLSRKISCSAPRNRTLKVASPEYSPPSLQEIMNDSTDDDRLANRAVIDKVNNLIETGPGRLFAVIQILGKQYRVTDQDIILIERNWPPKQNDKLSFEKVLLVGSSSFTLIGRPILPRNLIKVTGTIVHKDLTHTKMRYFNIPKERVHNLNFVREELTYIRINRVELYPNVNALEEAEYSPCRI